VIPNASDPGSTWHEPVLSRIVQQLLPDSGVVALLLVGSGARGRLDRWSDLDILLVARPEAIATYYPCLTWLGGLGQLYTWQLQDDGRTIRAVYDDLRRLDVIVRTEEEFSTVNEWGGDLLAHAPRTLILRSAAVERALSEPIPARNPSYPSSDEFVRIANDFWFKSVQAVSKLARNDRLIALHLALDLIEDCAVLGMILRDREASSNYHPDGAAGDSIVHRLRDVQRPFTTHGILETIEQCAEVWDELAARSSENYEPRRRPLLAWAEQLRRSLPSEEPTKLAGDGAGTPRSSTDV